MSLRFLCIFVAIPCVSHLSPDGLSTTTAAPWPCTRLSVDRTSRVLFSTVPVNRNLTCPVKQNPPPCNQNEPSAALESLPHRSQPLLSPRRCCPPDRESRSAERHHLGRPIDFSRRDQEIF